MTPLTNPAPVNGFDAIEDEYLRLSRNLRWAAICIEAGEYDLASELCEDEAQEFEVAA